MINYVKENILEVNRGIIAHGCNMMGVMGGGVALAIKNQYPLVFDRYVTELSRYKLGDVQFVDVTGQATLFVANMMTQPSHGNEQGVAYAKTEAISDGLNKVLEQASLLNLPVYTVPIGCGLGGLDWEDDVKDVFELQHMFYPDVELTVCDTGNIINNI